METLENAIIRTVNLDFNSEIYTMTYNGEVINTFTSYDDAFDFAHENNYRIDVITGLDDEDNTDYSDAVLALAQFLDVDPSDIEDNGNDYYEANGAEYIVCDNSTANDLLDAELEDYCDNYVLTEIPANLQCYFDTEKWKKDAEMDGRGHVLNKYDGGEDTKTVNGETYYIYRVN